MVSENDPNSTKLSQRASLLDPYSGAGSISKSPVLYNQKSSNNEDKSSVPSGALAFKPIKRPQPQPRSSAVISKAPTFNKDYIRPSQSTDTGGNAPVPSTSTAQPVSKKPTYEQWVENMPEDEEAAEAYVASRHQSQRFGRRQRKRVREKERAAKEAELSNWSAPYDPTRTTRYYIWKKYREESDRQGEEWREFLRNKGRRRHRSGGSVKDRKGSASRKNANVALLGMTFAPPSDYEQVGTLKRKASDDESYQPPPPLAPSTSNLSADATGDDAYARRMAMSDAVHGVPPPPPSAFNKDDEMEEYEPPPAAPSPTSVAGVTSRGPVHHDMPPPPPPSFLPKPSNFDSDMHTLHDTQTQAEETIVPPVAPSRLPVGDEQPAEGVSTPSSKRPGQKDFGKRMLAKWGWQKGSGLGAQGTGIATPLSVQLDKRMKKSDAEGGGFAGPAATARIVGGKLSKEGMAAQQAEKDEVARVGTVSEVIALDHMLDGDDLNGLLSDATFYQNLGDECGQNYGRTERIFVQPNGAHAGRVFIKFTQKISAMRALQAFQGRQYGSRVVEARYYDLEKFDKDH